MTRFYFETSSIDTEYDPRINQKPQNPKSSLVSKLLPSDLALEDQLSSI